MSFGEGTGMLRPGRLGRLGPFGRFGFALLLCAALAGLDTWLRPAAMPPALALTPTASGRVEAQGLALVARGNLPDAAGARVVHASNLLAMPEAHPWALLALWFAGSKEAAPDVNIAASQLERASGQWSEAQWVVDRRTVAAQLGHGLSRLGNPVSWLDASGRVHVFVVATGLGGWAASRIVHLRQTDLSFKGPVAKPPSAPHAPMLAFDAVRVLPLSWFWNTSFLVRAAPLGLQDGGMVLPVYFELGSSYPVALRFDGQGEFRGMVRMSGRKHLMQPTLLRLDDRHWLALMRNTSPDRKIAVAQTQDGGLHWSDLPDLALHNPDSSVAALSLALPGEQRFILAHNSLSQSRSVLDLSESSDGLDWSLRHTLARGAESEEFSYPSMAWADGSVWVSYTDKRHHIAWQRFSYQKAAEHPPVLR
ncbi:sialidase family protein [Rhodoferax sp. OV413]|uniref:exo-alpha-sialidase n=1 Tax=Rhodoferax sp. OV413 TaxID=1855285 RepID=UPI0025F7A3E3|nr:sialidase family protein [Rhodoferax sp. OV413]